MARKTANKRATGSVVEEQALPALRTVEGNIAAIEAQFNLTPGLLKAVVTQLTQPIFEPDVVRGINVPNEIYDSRFAAPQERSQYMAAEVSPNNTVTNALNRLTDEVKGMVIALDDLETRLGGILRTMPQPCLGEKGPLMPTKYAQDLEDLRICLNAQRCRLVEITLRVDL